MECEVKEVKNKYIIVQNNKVNYLIYIDENDEYEEKDTLIIKGNIVKLEKDLDIDVFEFSDYLFRQGIYYQIDTNDIEIRFRNEKASSKIKKKLTDKLYGESYDMTNMLLFNEKDGNTSNYENIKNINASHLFVVSGFHIAFLFNLICKIFKRKENIGLFVATFICLFYVFLLDFSVSSLRALLSLFLAQMFKGKLSKYDFLSIPGIFILMINPLNVFNYSFILSFLMTFSVVCVGQIVEKQKKIVQTLVITLFCFIAMIPLQLIMNYKVNFISLISNIILSYLVVIIFVLCLLGMMFSIFEGNMFGFIYKLFNKFVEQLSMIPSTIRFGGLKPWMTVTYYVLFILLLITLEKKNIKKKVFAFGRILAFLILLYNRKLLNPFQEVTFLNVYQGDCMIIRDSFSNKTMLIDTGGLTNYDIADKKIMPYLEYNGIRKIDKIVITHQDYDHCGALDSLKEKININEIIYSCENVDLGKIHLTNINKYYDEYSDDNEKSIVLYGKIGNINYLFTGDMTVNIENEIIKEYDDLPVDVLKVAHHGSDSSTSNEFISLIKPIYAIISVGKNNKYGHPTKSVLETLIQQDVIIYRTDMQGTIRVKGKILDYYYIETAK